MKRALHLSLCAGLLVAAGAAQAVSGFNGAMDPLNFSSSNTGTLVGAVTVPGAAQFSATSLKLTGGDTSALFPDTGCSGGTGGDVNSPCRIQTVVNLPGTYSFDWSYTSFDGGGPAYDLFGVLLDGVLTVITDPGGAWPGQGSSASYTVTSSFGWFLSCTDCTGGAAEAVVSNLSFAPAIPEPSTWALLLGGLGLVGVRKLRSRGVQARGF